MFTKGLPGKRLDPMRAGTIQWTGGWRGESIFTMESKDSKEFVSWLYVPNARTLPMAALDGRNIGPAGLGPHTGRQS